MFENVWFWLLADRVRRYIAVCRPFHRRIICTRTFARRAIATVMLIAAVVSVHKPLLSGVYDVKATRDVTTPGSPPAAADVTPSGVTSRENWRDDDESWAWFDSDVAAMLTSASGERRVCGRNPDYSWKSCFIAEIVYGLSITVIPFVPITVLNAAILRALVTRDRLATAGSTAAEISSSGAGGSGSRPRYKTVEKRVRREFTVILLVICASVLCLSLPYFFVWCRQNLQSRLVHPTLLNFISDTKTNKIQSQTADFAMVTPPGELDETRVVSDYSNSLYFVKT